MPLSIVDLQLWMSTENKNNNCVLFNNVSKMDTLILIFLQIKVQDKTYEPLKINIFHILQKPTLKC